MEKQPFIERMLETENLTDELEDKEANWLLNWGTAQLDEVLAGISDGETAGSKVNALMAVMRKINRLLGERQDLSAEELVEELNVLKGLFETAFGRTPAFEGVTADQLGALPTHQALELLTHQDEQQPEAGNQPGTEGQSGTENESGTQEQPGTGNPPETKDPSETKNQA